MDNQNQTEVQIYKSDELEKITKQSGIDLSESLGAAGHKKALDIHVKFEAFKSWAKSEIEKI